MSSEANGRWVNYVQLLQKRHGAIMHAAWNDREDGALHVNLILAQALETAYRFDYAEKHPDELVSVVMKDELDCCWNLARMLYSGRKGIEAILVMSAVDVLVKPEKTDGELTTNE